MQSPNEYEHGYINANAARVSEETPELSLHKPEMLRRCTDPLNPPSLSQVSLAEKKGTGRSQEKFLRAT